MKQKNLIIILGILALALNGSLYAGDPSPKLVKPGNIAKYIKLNPKLVKGLLFAPKIGEMKYKCCGSRSICLHTNVTNTNNSKQKYKVEFVGFQFGKCVLKSTAHCPDRPPKNYLCVPRCLKYAPIKKVTRIQSLFLAPKQTKHVSMKIENHNYLRGTKISVGSTSKLIRPPYLDCVR